MKLNIKNKLSSVFLILFLLIILSIPAIMVYSYRAEFEDFEISEMDVHLDTILDHTVKFYDSQSGDERLFFQKMSSYMMNHTDYGSLIMLDDDFEIVFPEDEPSKEARGALAEEFAAAIQQGMPLKHSYFDTSDGICYRVGLSSIERNNKGIMYTIAYYDTDKSTTRIDELESVYQQIAIFSFLFFLAVVVLFYWNYYRYMSFLSKAILRIGEEDYSPLTMPLSLGAAEKLRVSVNKVQEQLKRSANRRETLVRSTNHFINNHLMAVDGYAQGIEAGVFDPAEAAGKIRMENRVIEDLLHNISVQSFLQEHTMPENDEVLCITEEIEECMNKYRESAERKNVTLSLLPGNTEGSVRGTKSLVEAVMDNLISNAVRYAASEVTVSIEEVDDQITVRVKDDGMGISRKDLPHIFEPLYKGVKGNVGIGLSVANEAARYMNGSIRAENSPDGGAVFIFSVPAY